MPLVSWLGDGRVARSAARPARSSAVRKGLGQVLSAKRLGIFPSPPCGKHPLTPPRPRVSLFLHDRRQRARAQGFRPERALRRGGGASATIACPRASRRRRAAGCGGEPRGNLGRTRKGLAKFVERVNTPQMKDDLIPFRVGMTVKVGVTVVEGGKSRVQPYEGIVIAIHRAGVATSTVRKSFQGYGVERIFPIHSPLCSFEEIRGAGKPVVRRAKLYYLRNLVGKKAKLKTRFVAKKTGLTRHQVKMEAPAATKAAAAAEAEAAAAAAAKAEEDADAAAAAAEAAPAEEREEAWLNESTTY